MTEAEMTPLAESITAGMITYVTGKTGATPEMARAAIIENFDSSLVSSMIRLGLEAHADGTIMRLALGGEA